ncbi:hypothetical protein SAV31267_023650 [Streptomyces avermitilis]|nr:hypothetical protein SAV31267_023650 [Streptomyces avermitilis]
MIFPDEPIPDFPASVPAEVTAVARPALAKGARQALVEVFPDRATLVEQIARLLERHPDEEASLETFGQLVRLLVEARPQDPQDACAADTLATGGPVSGPEMLSGTRRWCAATSRGRSTGSRRYTVRARRPARSTSPSRRRGCGTGRTSCCGRPRTTR